MTNYTSRERDSKQESKRKRRVPSSTACDVYGERFWAPTGEVLYPYCGKRTVVEYGITGNPMGFFGSLLEGIALSGSISRIEVSHHYPLPSRRSNGLSDAWQKVIPETPHCKRHTEGRNRSFGLQGETESAWNCTRENKY